MYKDQELQIERIQSHSQNTYKLETLNKNCIKNITKIQDHVRYHQCDSGKNCYNSSKNCKNIVGWIGWEVSMESLGLELGFGGMVN